VPKAGPHAETANVVRRHAADDAIKDDPLELALEVALHRQQFRPQHLEVHDERFGPVEAGVDRLVDDRVGVGGLLRHALNGSLENLVFVLPHDRTVVRRTAASTPE
jgi:hypothetical protein